MKKKFSLMLLVACMMFAVTGCSDEEEVMGDLTSTDEMIEVVAGDEASYDLNGDGEEETIVYEIRQEDPDEEFSKYAVITVNGEEYEVEVVSPLETIACVKLDSESDEYTLLVGDEGPSNDYTTQYYAYDGEKLEKIGETGGILGNESEIFRPLLLNGDGTVTAPERAGIVQTWWYDATYELTNGKLELVEQEFYPTCFESATLMDYDFYTDTDVESEKVSLPAGTEVILSGTDNEEWTEIIYTDENGEEQAAYFRVTNFYLVDGDENLTTEMLFKDLVFAD